MVFDPVDVVRAHGGHACSRDILARVTRPALSAAVHDRRLVRAARGIYALPDLPDPELAATRARGVVSHASAARWWGLELVHAPDAVHVTVPHGARPALEAGVRLHWSREPLDPGRVTPVVRTVLDCATAMPFVDALAVADSALAFSFADPHQLVAAALAGSRRHRQRRLRVVRAADRRAANAFESRLRALVLEAGYDGFEPQLEIRTPAMVVHVDLGDPDRRIVLEADSFTHHGSRSALARDCERYDELATDGWIVLRFAWEHVMFKPEWVVATVAAACRSGRGFVTYGRRAASLTACPPQRMKPRRSGAAVGDD